MSVRLKLLTQLRHVIIFFSQHWGHPHRLKISRGIKAAAVRPLTADGFPLVLFLSNNL